MAFIFVPNADGSFTEGDKQTNPDTGVEYIYDSGAWRALGPKIEDEFDTLDNRYATNEYVDTGDKDVKDYVDDAIEAIPDTDLSNYIKNEGTTDLPDDTDWKIKQHNAGGSNKTLLQVKEGSLGLYNLKEPSQPHHAATKSYVDSNVGSGAFNIDLWTYRGSGNTGNDLNDGEFKSKKMANGVLELYLAHKNSRGVIYYPSPPNSTNEYSHQITESNQGGSPMTVMHKDGRCLWYAETKKIVFNKSTGNYVLIEAIKYRAAFDLLVEGEQYMLNVAGFLSPVSGW